MLCAPDERDARAVIDAAPVTVSARGAIDVYNTTIATAACFMLLACRYAMPI